MPNHRTTEDGKPPSLFYGSYYRVQGLFSLAMLMMNLGVHVGVPNNAGGLEKNSKLIEMTC